MKKILLILLFIFKLNSFEVSSIPSKFTLFYGSDFISTFCHEMGHAIISKIRGQNPKIILGDLSKIEKKTNFKYNPNDPFIRIDNFDPSEGVTIPDSKKFESPFGIPINKCLAHKHLLQVAMGGICGITSKLLQLKIAKNKLSPKLYNSFENYIAGRILRELIYAFTPICDNGDGDQFWAMMILCYANKFKPLYDIDIYGKSLKNNLEKFSIVYLGYHAIYFSLKLIKKTGLLDKIKEKINCLPLKMLENYTKYGLVRETSDAISKKTETPEWPIRFILNAITF